MIKWLRAGYWQHVVPQLMYSEDFFRFFPDITANVYMKKKLFRYQQGKINVLCRNGLYLFTPIAFAILNVSVNFPCQLL